MAAKVTAKDRKDAGFSDDSYPCNTAAQCISAIRLRGNNKKGHSKAQVLSHVARQAAILRRKGKISEQQYEDIKKRIAEARQADA